MTIMVGIWQQLGSRGAGAVLESLHLIHNHESVGGGAFPQSRCYVTLMVHDCVWATWQSRGCEGEGLLPFFLSL